jgi:hypothetical protein
MVIAMVAMRVMQVAVDEIIDVIPVRHGGMAAAWAMNVAGRMRAATVIRRAGRGVRPRHFQDVLLHLAAVGIMQVAVVEIVHVVSVLNGGVPATWPMLMRVVRMTGHKTPPWSVSNDVYPWLL